MPAFPFASSACICCVGRAGGGKLLITSLALIAACSLALAALFFAFVPWGFASFLNGDGSSNSGASGIGGGGELPHLLPPAA